MAFIAKFHLLIAFQKNNRACISFNKNVFAFI